MRPKRDPVPRAKEPGVWLAGTFLLGILGAGVVAAAVMLWEHVDIRQLTPGLSASTPALPTAVETRTPTAPTRPFSAVLLNSPRNAAYFPDPSYYARELDRWRELVGSIGGSLREAATAEGLRSADFNEVLVVPEAPCLSGPEVRAIQAHLAQGGSLVSNWAVGVRDADCEWQGWSTLLEFTEADEVQELPSREGLFMTVPFGVPLAAGFEPGTRIELRPDPSLALRMPGARVYWSDWALNPAPDEEGFGADVAAAAGRTPQGGRTAWFGLRVGQAATARDSTAVRRLVQNGLRWAAGTPTASVAPWPGGARAAMAFVLDVEDQPQNATLMADFLREEQLPGTFFAVTRLVADDPELARALSAAGEVGTHTSDHQLLAGLTPQDQTVRLRRARAEIEAWTGVRPLGLRPPEEAFDSVTIESWFAAGGDYLVARNEARSASPEIHHTGDGAVVLLPRLLKDDYNVIVQDRAIRAERIGAAFLEGSSKLHAIGGLAVVAGHTQIIDSARRVQAFRVVADSARASGDWWIASTGDIASWWRGRSEIELDFTAPATTPMGSVASHVSDLTVRSGRGSVGADVWVDVTIPGGTLGITPLVDGVSVDFATTEWGMRVPLGPLLEGAEKKLSFVQRADDRGLRPAGASGGLSP